MAAFLGGWNSINERLQISVWDWSYPKNSFAVVWIIVNPTILQTAGRENRATMLALKQIICGPSLQP